MCELGPFQIQEEPVRKLKCTLCTSKAGWQIYPTYAVTRAGTKRKLSDKWSSFKQNVKEHVMSNSHDEERVKSWQATEEGVKHQRENFTALTNLARIVLKNMVTGASFNTFPLDILINVRANVNVGFQNHSASYFPPRMVDCYYEMLRANLVAMIHHPTPYGTAQPVSLTADKDRAKKRAKQLMDLTYTSDHGRKVRWTIV